MDWVNKSSMEVISRDSTASPTTASAVMPKEDGQLGPEVGEIVALVAGNSTLSDPQIFLAKILSFSKTNVQLQNLEKVYQDDNLYRPSIGNQSIWWESRSAIIWPLFCCFDHAERGYRLHSTPLEIVRQSID